MERTPTIDEQFGDGFIMNLSKKNIKHLRYLKNKYRNRPPTVKEVQETLKNFYTQTEIEYMAVRRIGKIIKDWMAYEHAKSAIAKAKTVDINAQAS